MRIALIASLTLVIAGQAAHADRPELAIENTWSSEAKFLDDDTLRISTRKRIAGDLEEINKPGTSVYDTFQRVQQATLLRAALECRHLGLEFFTVTGIRNITRERDRNRVSGNATEGDFTMAPGHYQAEIDLGIQVTVDLLPSPAPDPLPESTYSANEILIANGLAEARPVESTHENNQD